ncbi:hypothetical protein FCL40_16085 [Ferrimonas sediminicola]|uniref:Cell division protein FtsL n=1 Tax=Ferrimonas sediminicola TaxID=2569538 RepID=A0A4U1B926_9GAMM|nr:hypothetical protein [Ferrimonas sediminicola]TKB47221.1 hypothetical protein FCL40_16085 [Ferrimonas sediminicola]
MSCSPGCRLKGYLLALLASVTLVSLVWAVDKHHRAAELQQQLVNEQARSDQQQQQLESLAEELRQWRELEEQRREIRRRYQEARDSGKSVVLENNGEGVTTFAQPHGGVKITRTPSAR